MTKNRMFGLLVALALVLAACGDGDSADTTTAPPPEATTTTTDAPQTTTTTAAPATTTTTATETTEAGGTDSAALEGIRAAFTQTSETLSGRMEGSFTITGMEGIPGGGEMAMPFAGAFAESGDFSFSLDMSGLAAQAGEEIPEEFAGLLGAMEVRQVGDTVYINFPFFTMFLGIETEWLSAPAEEGDAVTGGFGVTAPSNPADILDSFGDAEAEVEEIGRETVNGVEATHYRIVFDAEKLYEMASPEEKAEFEAQSIPIAEVPMDVWITDDGIVTRFVMEIDGADVEAAEGESFESMVVTYDLFDFGADIVIEAPPADAVTDAEALGDFFNFDIEG